MLFPFTSEVLCVGGVASSEIARARLIHTGEEADAAQNGEILRRWDFVSVVGPSVFRLDDLKLLRKQSDTLADNLVDYLDLKPMQDSYQRLMDELESESPHTSAIAFWNAFNLEPPAGISGLSLLKDGEKRSSEEMKPDRAIERNSRTADPCLEEGQAVFWRYSASVFGSLLHFSLAGGFSSPRLGATMRETGYLTSAHKEATYKRLLETTLFVVDAMTDMTVGTGRGFKSALRVRLLHAQVRRRIATGHGKLNTYDSDVSGIPINQADLATVLGSFMIAPLWSLRRTGIELSPQEILSYQVAWRHIGFYLGIDTDLLMRCYGHSHATAETSFASLAFDAFPTTRPPDALNTPTYQILQAVSDRPPRPSRIGYQVEYSRLLLGPRLSEHLALPRGTWSDAASVKLDVAMTWVLIQFGRSWRTGWETERVTLFRGIMELVVVWQLGEKRTTYAWREESRRGEQLGEDEGEGPGIKMGREVGLAVKARWKWLFAEMVLVLGTGTVGVVVGLGIVLKRVGVL